MESSPSKTIRTIEDIDDNLLNQIKKRFFEIYRETNEPLSGKIYKQVLNEMSINPDLAWEVMQKIDNPKRPQGASKPKDAPKRKTKIVGIYKPKDLKDTNQIDYKMRQANDNSK